MVVTSAVPTEDTGNEQDRSGRPSRKTVQAPHCAMPHPNLVPVRPIASRNTQSSGVSVSTSTLWMLPFTFTSNLATGASLSQEGAQLATLVSTGKKAPDGSILTVGKPGGDHARFCRNLRFSAQKAGAAA
jgi:hypothetical protein